MITALVLTVASAAGLALTARAAVKGRWLPEARTAAFAVSLALAVYAADAWVWAVTR